MAAKRRTAAVDTEREQFQALLARQSALIEQQGETMASLNAEIQGLKANQPRFQPMERVKRAPTGGYVPPERLTQRAMRELPPGQSSRTLMDSAAYRATLPPQYRPAFSKNEVVRLNLDATPHGMEGGATWGSILGAKGIQVGEGVVGNIRMTKSWEPKYMVRFPGLTAGSGDGFYESELLPVEG